MALRRSRVVNAILALVAPVLLAAAATAGATTDLLLLLPAILAFLPLLAGRYLGEERLARLVRARHQRGRRRVPAATGWPVPGVRRRRFALTPRGGSLIAAALAVRPPPVSARAS